MVRFFRKYLLILVTFSVLSLNACNNDFWGLFGSNDLNIRWQERNTFNFLTDADRNITLGDEYSFIVITDTHIYNGNTFGLEKLKDAIDDDVKFVVFTGDITQNGQRDDLEKFIEIAKSLGVPCYPVLGNHDIYSGNWQHWKELIGSTCYRIDSGSTSLLILDSADEYLGTKQVKWLKEELEKTKDRVFIFTHVNLFSKNIKDIQHLTDTNEKAMVTSTLHGHCDAIFMGHVHRRIINESGGVKYITIEDYLSNSVYCQVWVSKEEIR